MNNTGNNGPDFEQMRVDLMERVETLARRRRIKVRVGIAGGAVAVAALATGAALIVQASPAEISNAVYCYEEASTTSRYGEAMMADSTPTAAPGTAEQRDPDRVREAISQCQSVWQIGAFDPDAATSNQEQQAPELFACKRNDGVLAVFPHDPSDPKTCKDIGLQPAK